MIDDVYDYMDDEEPIELMFTEEELTEIANLITKELDKCNEDTPISYINLLQGIKDKLV